MGFPASLAVGTTIFAVVFTAKSGAWGHLMRRNLDKRAALQLGSGGILGVLLGSWLFTFLTSHQALLGLILGLLFLTMGISLAVMAPLALVGGLKLKDMWLWQPVPSWKAELPIELKQERL